MMTTSNFYIKDKNSGDIFRVYAVHRVPQVTEFLIYSGKSWKWRSNIQNYEPLIDENIEKPKKDFWEEYM